ncbi:MAG: DUF2834 domain-containing protein [Cryomorphaceae bacterium]
MKKLYLLLSIIGFLAPNILVTIESFESGNILLYTNPMATIEGMFENRISSIFMIDLLFTVMVFFFWTYFDGKKAGIKNIGLVWISTLLLGLAGGFPFYLYLKEKATANKS